MIICLLRCNLIVSASTARHLLKPQCILTSFTPLLCTWVLPWRQDTMWPTLGSVRLLLTMPPAPAPKRRPQPPRLSSATVAPAQIATVTIPAAVLEDYSAFSSLSQAAPSELNRWTIREIILLSYYAGRSILIMNLNVWCKIYAYC